MVERKYEMGELKNEDALKLLKWKAFKTNEISPSYVDILSRVVTYAAGLPLALEVIGSYLYKKSIEECKHALDRYEKIPIQEIQKVLKVSYDALDEEEKSVFLGIACCFRGYKLTKLEKILHAHYDDNKKHHIGVLAEKSLIKIIGFGYVTLHDLIEDMGKEIVRQESPEEPGKRSRLWFHKDIVQVLRENTVSEIGMDSFAFHLKLRLISFNYYCYEY
uniref:Disease resistance protein Roq1-like winged-helix domain-containing protein n=1 Tax=Lotus japonicus TaxID=34305 RepID=I3SZY9_LOTJA|nr:unknown [Lotus japonicus]